MNKKRPALGRGLGALIPEKRPPATTLLSTGSRGEGSPRRLPIERVFPNRDQPRKRFDPRALGALAESIRAQGIIQPIVVTPVPDKQGQNSYQIIAGERRWRAAQMAGLHEVPVFIRDTPERERLELALVENIQRAELDPIEEAEAYNQLIALHSYTQEQLASRVGKERSTVANALRLLKLPEKVRDLVAERSLSMGHARALLSVNDPREMLRLAHDVVRKKWSVRATEAQIRKLSRPQTAPESSDSDGQRRHNTIVSDLEMRLQRKLGTRVTLKTGGKDNKGPGAIHIPYGDLDELNRLLHILMSAGDETT